MKEFQPKTLRECLMKEQAYDEGYQAALVQLEKVASEAFDAGYDYAVEQFEQYEQSEQYEKEDNSFSQCFYTESEQELDTVISSLFKDRVAEEKGEEFSYGNDDVEDLDEHKYHHYFKDVRLLDYIDVYMINKLFPSNDDSGAIDHARKKLLVTGNRGGGKSSLEDIIEARDTLNRYLEIEGSNTKPDDECDTDYGTSHWGYHGE